MSVDSQMSSQHSFNNMLDLKEIKNLQLSILKEIHNFCIENDIQYSLAHGTLLGAVRHKGFIPWDDDIDICLLEKDYELFMKSFSHPYLKALCIENDSCCPFPYGKVYDNRTIAYEDAYISYNYGVNIDVFPIYHYPDSRFAAAILRFKLFLLGWIHNIKIIKLSKQRHFLKNIILAILKIICLPLCFLHVNRLIRQVCLAADRTTSSQVFETRSAQTVIYKAESFSGYDMMMFEGGYFKVMRGWDSYLSARHGNYMKMPPHNQRVPHHNIAAHWKDEI